MSEGGCGVEVGRVWCSKWGGCVGEGVLGRVWYSEWGGCGVGSEEDVHGVVWCNA